VLGLVVAVLFAALLGRVWSLQVMSGERYADQARANAVETVQLEAPRGRILARNGEPLAVNRSALAVTVEPATLERSDEPVLVRLAGLLGRSAAELAERVEAGQRPPTEPRTVAVDVGTETAFRIHEHAADFPGVAVTRRPVRAYPHGRLAAHALGYLTAPSGQRLDTADGPNAGQLDPGDRVGASGVESLADRALRGVDGTRQVVVDARGRRLQTLDRQPARRGRGLRLSLDLPAQRLAEQALAAAGGAAGRGNDASGASPEKPTRGAVVALEPDTGKLAVLASAPRFSPSEFVGGVSDAYWRSLQQASAGAPLVNRALRAHQAPASVFKVVTAAAALRGGDIRVPGGPSSAGPAVGLDQAAGPGSAAGGVDAAASDATERRVVAAADRKEAAPTRLPCPASWRWGSQTFDNWRDQGVGALTLPQALADSCDTVFYELARRMWQDDRGAGLAELARAWGFGSPPGLGLSAERAGRVPGPGDQTWRGGDLVNMAIGQGGVTASPLQVANAYAAIANRGPFYRPSLTVGAREPLGQVPVADRHLAAIERGLVSATTEGTANPAFAGFPVPVAGKTGTAQRRGAKPTAWFAGYAPVADPEYVVVAMVEQAGSGGAVAAPIARRVLSELLGPA
jgi:penicillin-binding protein 2